MFDTDTPIALDREAIRLALADDEDLAVPAWPGPNEWGAPEQPASDVAAVLDATNAARHPDLELVVYAIDELEESGFFVAVRVLGGDNPVALTRGWMRVDEVIPDEPDRFERAIGACEALVAEGNAVLALGRAHPGIATACS